MKRLIIVLFLSFVHAQAGEVAPSMAEPASAANADFIEQIRQVIGGKVVQPAEAVRPVVDPAAEDKINEQELQGAEDFDFEQESSDSIEEINSEREELSGQEMSEHFVDAVTEATGGVNR